MLTLKAVQDYIISLGIADSDHVYIGKLDNKKQKSIGIYSRQTNGQPNMALGGLDCTTFDVKAVSLLIHWNKRKDETERTACELFEILRTVSSLTLGNTHINFLRLMVPEPQDVGTDENGVYEYVIWLDFIYQRK